MGRHETKVCGNGRETVPTGLETQDS